MAFTKESAILTVASVLTIISLLFDFVYTISRNKIQLGKQPPKVIVGHRTRTLRLLINLHAALDAKSLTTQQLRTALEAKFGTSLSKQQTILSLASDMPHRLCATITLDEVDSVALAQDSFELDLEFKADIRSPAHVTVDTDFLGITTLYDGAVGKNAADILVVPGLGSHAFGSFKSTNSGEDWLRDYLPVALPNVRVLLYGYDTSLVNSSAKESIIDLARRLVTSIHAHRRHGTVKFSASDLHHHILTLE